MVDLMVGKKALHLVSQTVAWMAASLVVLMALLRVDCLACFAAESMAVHWVLKLAALWDQWWAGQKALPKGCKWAVK